MKTFYEVVFWVAILDKLFYLVLTDLHFIVCSESGLNQLSLSIRHVGHHVVDEFFLGCFEAVFIVKVFRREVAALAPRALHDLELELLILVLRVFVVFLVLIIVLLCMLAFLRIFK